MNNSLVRITAKAGIEHMKIIWLMCICVYATTTIKQQAQYDNNKVDAHASKSGF